MKNKRMILGITIAAMSIGAFGIALSTTVKKESPIVAEAAQHAGNFDLYTYSGSYYNGIATDASYGMNGSLRTTLTSLIFPKGWYKYSSDGSGTLSEQLQKADEDPTNSSNMVLLYTRNSITKCYSKGASNWNREHVWPQANSNGNWGQDEAGTDLLHIRPTYETPNGTRGNLKYGETTTSSPLTYNGMNYGYKAGGFFMPLDASKGDVARICMYVWVAYKSTYSNLPEITSTFRDYDTLMKWHLEDKPDELEGNRNDYVQSSKQKNRNPFVDHPEYAWMIFGEKCSADVLARAKETYPASGEIVEKTLSDITLSNVVTEYPLNGTFVKPTVIATFSDNSTENVTNLASFSGFSLSTEGSQTVEVSYTYNGVTKSKTYEITVSAEAPQPEPEPEKTPVSIRVDNPKTEYYRGEEFVSPDVYLVYDDGSEEDITGRVVFRGFDASKAGEVTIKVIYEAPSGQIFSTRYTVKIIGANGCGGNIIASSVILSTLSLVGITLLIIRKRKARVH